MSFLTPGAEGRKKEEAATGAVGLREGMGTWVCCQGLEKFEKWRKDQQP